MTKSFDEFWGEFAIGLNADENEAESIYEAGQKSRQAEVDELQKRGDDALKELECIHFYKTQNSNNAIKILKGDSHES